MHSRIAIRAWKSGQMLTGLVALLLWTTCSESGTDVAVESVSGALAA